MASKNNDDIPPVPLPPAGSTIPPVEPPPAAPAAPEAPVAPAAPAEPTPNPYAAPTEPAPPAAGYSAQPAAGYSAPPAASPAVPPVAPAPQPYGGAAYTPQPAGPSQALSITSMALGIGGLLLLFFGLGFFPSLAAVITGHIAQKRQPYAKPFWLTGIITGYAGVGVSLVIGAIAAFFFLVAIGSVSYFG